MQEQDNYQWEYPEFYERYLHAAEPDVTERALAWDVAVGLQAVDGLEVSDYLREVADEHICGHISITEVQQRVAEYYAGHGGHGGQGCAGSDEADKVAANIASLLNEPAFHFSPAGLAAIHKRLFHNVFKFAGKIRDYNITKKEWVLEGDTVRYAHAAEIIMALDYDMEKERNFSFRGITQDKLAEHLARFIANIWQVHPFPEGNTRSTAVFCIKYLRYLGFQVTNQPFARHARYFRDALVRANYNNAPKGIFADYSFLIKFFRNLLLGESHELKSRHLHVRAEAPVQVKYEQGISTDYVRDKLAGQAEPPANYSVAALLSAIGGEYMSVLQMMQALKLKGRANFVKNYLTPALEGGWLCMLYPDSPRHPRQKYRLTPRGSLALQTRRGC